MSYCWLAAPWGYRMAVEQTLLHRMEIKIWASISSDRFQSIRGIINCRFSEEWHLKLPDNSAGPFRWLMTSSLLFKQVGIGVGGLPPTLLDNHVKDWWAWLPIRGAMNGLHVGWDNNLSLRVVRASKQITSGLFSLCAYALQMLSFSVHVLTWKRLRK